MCAYHSFKQILNILTYLCCLIGIAGLTLPKDRKANEKLSVGGFDSLRDSIGKSNNHTSGDEGVVLSNSNSQTFLAVDNANNSNKHNDSQSSNSSNAKKRHRRMKSKLA